MEAGFALPRVADLDFDGVPETTDNNGDGLVDESDRDVGFVLPEPSTEMAVIVPGALPLAFTNPIYVDIDGKGFQPNGDSLGHPLLTAKR